MLLYQLFLSQKGSEEQEILKSKPHMSSSKPQPSSQAHSINFQQRLQTTLEAPTCNNIDQEPSQETKNCDFQTQTKTFNPYMDIGELNKEQILGMQRENIAKLILALIEKIQEQEVYITQLEKEIE